MWRLAFQFPGSLTDSSTVFHQISPATLQGHIMPQWHPAFTLPPQTVLQNECYSSLLTTKAKIDQIPWCTHTTHVAQLEEI